MRHNRFRRCSHNFWEVDRKSLRNKKVKIKALSFGNMKLSLLKAMRLKDRQCY